MAHANPSYEFQKIQDKTPNSKNWNSVVFTESFAAPPVVIMGPLSANEADPATVRVRNVTATGFEWQIDEWDYLDGVHGYEDLAWLAMEPGVHDIDGLIWEAGRSNAGDGLASVALAGGFANQPVVLSQAETTNNLVHPGGDSVAVAVRTRSVTATGFEIQLQDQQANADPLLAESVGWIAISQGDGFLGNRPYSVIRTADELTHAPLAVSYPVLLRNPALFANQQTRDGGDVCRIRYQNLGDSAVELWTEEEQSADSEVGHTTEVGGLLVIGDPYGEEDAKLDLFSIQVNHNWKTVNLAETYHDPVVVAGPPSYHGGDKSTVRVRNVTSTSFEVQIDEWDYRDVGHATETVSILVMERGVFEIGGQAWQAGVAENVSDSAGTVEYADTFGSAPVLLGQVVSTNEASAVTHRFSDIDEAGFSLFLQEEKGNDGTHAGETVHYLAVEPGQGSFTTGNGVLFSAVATPEEVTHANYPLDFGANYALPLFFADMRTFNEADPATVRLKTSGVPGSPRLSAGGATLFLEEEDSTGDGLAHAAEAVGYLVVSTAVDSDGDGLGDDWEIQHGLDPNDPGDAALDPDADLLTNLEEYELNYDPGSFNAGLVFAYRSSAWGDASEKEGARARFRLYRRGSGRAAFTAQIAVDGGSDPDAAASSGDYVFTLADGTPAGGAVSFGVNTHFVDLYADPVDDGAPEYPENVRLTLLADPDYDRSTTTRTAKIIDAQDTPANERLFVGLYQPEPWAQGQTSASGYATFLVNGPNTSARVSSSFSGLTTPQTVAHIHHADPSNPNGAGGPIVIGLPDGQVDNHQWSIVPTGAYTGQDLVDTLYGTNGLFLYVNVHTTEFPAGEIRAVMNEEENGPFDPPAPPPAIDPLTGDDLTRDVARFLTQATFGPTQAEIEALRDDIVNNHGGDRMAGFEAWIDAQFALERTSLHDLTYAADQQEWDLRDSQPIGYSNSNDPDWFNRRRAWWTISSQAEDQLHQRVGMALSEILVVSGDDVIVRVRHYGAANYYDMLVNHSDGNYRDLLEGVSKSPVMGTYLSHLKNRKEVVDPNTGDVLISPDENYAREIMQLFSIGLLELNPDGTLALDGSGRPVQTYDNEDIKALSRVFTGWSFSKWAPGPDYETTDNSAFFRGYGHKYFQATMLYPMKNFAAYHDTDAKLVLGTTIPAGNDGQEDLDDALAILHGHQNLGPFLARLMIQRMTHSNPSRGYVYRVAQAFENGTYNGSGSGQRGDIGAMVRAILLDYEARNLDLADDVGYGKQKEPIIRFLQLIRALEGGTQLPISDLSAYGYPATQLDNFPVGATRLRFPDTTTNLSQTPLRAPTVFNWFLPDYDPGGAISAAGLVAPEMLVTTETQVVRSINYTRNLLHYSTFGLNQLVGQSDNLLDNLDINPGREDLEDLYLAEIAAGKTDEEAATTVVDHLDVLLMAGNLKATYEGAAAPNPRDSIIWAVANTTNSNATTEIRWKIRNALYLIAASPEYIHQK